MPPAPPFVSKAVRAVKGAYTTKLKQSRDVCLDNLFHGLTEEWGPRELACLEFPISAPSASRVIVIRHGMGYHNDGVGVAGTHTVNHRDAHLNEVGLGQAALVGSALRAAGVPDKIEFLVVSPFRRAMETAVTALTPEKIEELSTPNEAVVVTPLAAEHTMPWSVVSRGDRGSTAAALQRDPQFFCFDLSPLDDYCIERSLPAGKWWHHTHGTKHEMPEQFAARAVEFRSWLGKECKRRRDEAYSSTSEPKGPPKGKVPRLTVIFSHGGLLHEAFGGSKYQNCEFRVFDVFPSGNFVRVSNPNGRASPVLKCCHDPELNITPFSSRGPSPAPTPPMSPSKQLHVLWPPAPGLSGYSGVPPFTQGANSASEHAHIMALLQDHHSTATSPEAESDSHPSSYAASPIVDSSRKDSPSAPSATSRSLRSWLPGGSGKPRPAPIKSKMTSSLFSFNRKSPSAFDSKAFDALGPEAFEHPDVDQCLVEHHAPSHCPRI
mmetsp:Transcript_15384/g.36340  ORF Transcript_15384/g.36340 Transcript_15384/m.36340 type:complete len:492 (+) Transcript_15384:41-1516(+)